ncbi:MAG: C4-type zinc ribbon domain-containing protein [Blastocatellia bacterium]|nr:C4-type zinc ribbon domain-containing protein [Blastocatellia bacterium]MCS7158425.1 C4-type zinc ribbon domain-containing protein [Blastocatellia bacterium]MCX7752931.1 C4-type zinc ribbon domain-containing protein [Blastocatellia bacterium]MDW8167987.1 C4-type zinc ribbon domain-containing protein [Acidobacteriota bacterium]MDW8256362.1 C4-type zinc ribbon domain-containing protein [Acidobacteriota bacterium]
MNPELEKLIALQELDLKIRALEEEIATVPTKRAELEREFETFAAEYLEKKSRLETSKRQHRQLEMDLQDAQLRLEKYKNDLMRVRNQTEYAAALREIDMAKKLVSALETQILELLETIETLEREVQERTPEIEAKRQHVDALLAEYATAVERLTEELNRMRQQRERLMQTIRPDLLNRYMRLVELRDGLALAEVRDGSCTACYMTIRPQVYADVRKGEEILTCDHCSRILYYRGAAVESSESVA